MKVTTRIASIVAAGAVAVTPVVVAVGAGSASASTHSKAKHAVAHAASCINQSWKSTGSPLWIRQGEGAGYALATNGYHPNGAGFPNGSNFHGQCTGTGWLFVTNNGDYPTGYVNANYAHSNP